MTKTGQRQHWVSAVRWAEAGRLLAQGTILAFAIIATPPAQAQTFTLLHSFTGGADGADPSGSLIGDAAGNLYGTTSDPGVVFQLSASGYTVLYRFTRDAGGAQAIRSDPGRGGQLLRHDSVWRQI